MARNTQRKTEADTPSPDIGNEVPEPRPPAIYEPSHVIQQLYLVQKDIAILIARHDHTKESLVKIETKIETIGTNYAKIQGAVIAAIFLIPACAGIIWWIIGERLTDIKNQLVLKPSIESRGHSEEILVPLMKLPQKNGKQSIN